MRVLSGMLSLCLLIAALPVGAPAAGSNSVQALIDARVAAHPGTGIVVGVIDHGKISLYQAGVSGNARPLDEHTLFEIGSVTKTFTATVLASMVQQGNVHLDDPVAKYLPSSVTVPSRDGKAITLLNLATQHSGLPRIPSDIFDKSDAGNPYAHYSVDDLYHFLSGYTLTRDPGETYEYSNLGVGLLGLALSHVAGTSYEEMVRSYVWKPLNMSETRITLAPSDEARFAVGHDDADLPVHSWEFTDAFAGAGAIRSDLHDMLLYLDAAMGNGPLGAAMTFAQQPRADIDANTRIGLIWWIDEKYGLIQHGGDTAGYHAMVMMTADRTRGVVMLSNGPMVADIAGHILNPDYPLMPARHLAALTDDQIAEYVGTYVNGDAGITYVVTRQGRQIVARIVGQQAAPIFPSRADHFFYTAVAAYIEFVRQNGRVVGLILTQNGQTVPMYKQGADGKPLATHLEPDYPPAVTLDSATLQSYVGSYVLHGYTLAITVSDGHVFAKLASQPSTEIYPSAKDRFYLKIVDAQLVFSRDATGAIDAVTLYQNGYVQRFERKP